MINSHNRNNQGGMALVVSMLFLVVISLISIVAVSNSRSALQMSMNSQDSLHSFQAAEAGVYAVLATAGTAGDIFDGTDTADAFGSLTGDDNPLAKLDNGAASVRTDVLLTSASTACPRRAIGSSVGLFDCDYYRVESSHAVAKRAQTQINMGVVKTLIGAGAR